MNNNFYSIILKEKKTFVALMLTFFLIALSVYFYFFVVIAFGISIYMLLTEKPDAYLKYLIALLPWAYIYKFNGISTSLFVILVFLSAFKYLINIRYFNRIFCGIIILFLVYVIVRMRLFDSSMVFMFLKFMINLLLLYEMCAIHKSKNLSSILLFFAISVILASFFAYCVPDRSVFNDRINTSVKLVEHQYARFKGLQNDPNYYNSSLIISILFMSYLFIKKTLSFIQYTLLSALCVFFGLLTYSKSFLLLLVMLLGAVVYYSLKQRRYWFFIVLSLISIIVVLYLFSGRVETVSVIIRRFSGTAGLTSGRIEIWKMYFAYFSNDIFMFIFGNGFESIILESHAAHNTFIDIVYCFGLFGLLLVFFMVILCFRQRTFNSKRVFGYLFLFFILFEFLSLSCITTCEFPFLLFFAFMFFADDENSNQEFIDNSEIDNMNVNNKNDQIQKAD